MRNATCLILAAVLVCGCASQRRAAAPAVAQSAAAPSQADANRLWSVSLRVVGERFPVKAAQEADGTIETDWLIGPLSETGFKSNSVTANDAASDALHTIRRRAFVSISREDGSLSVRVEKERMVRTGPPALPVGTYSLDVTRPEGETAQEQRWVSLGRDAALEGVIEHEISRRFRAGAS